MSTTSNSNMLSRHVIPLSDSVDFCVFFLLGSYKISRQNQAATLREGEESEKMHQQQQPAIDDDGGGRTGVRYNRNLSPSVLQRRNSIATSVVVPIKLSLQKDPNAKNFHAYSFPNGRNPPASLNFDLNSYTSLQDILPPAATVPALYISSSTTNTRSSILKQAAWSYLHQTSSSPRSSGDGFLHRLWLRFSAPVNACLGFISRAVDRILRTVLVRSTG